MVDGGDRMCSEDCVLQSKLLSIIASALALCYHESELGRADTHAAEARGVWRAGGRMSSFSSPTAASETAMSQHPVNRTLRYYDMPAYGHGVWSFTFAVLSKRMVMHIRGTERGYDATRGHIRGRRAAGGTRHAGTVRQRLRGGGVGRLSAYGAAPRCPLRQRQRTQEAQVRAAVYGGGAAVYGCSAAVRLFIEAASGELRTASALHGTNCQIFWYQAGCCQYAADCPAEALGIGCYPEPRLLHRILVSSYASAMTCAVLTWAMLLPARSTAGVMGRGCLVQPPISLCDCYAMPGTELAYERTQLSAYARAMRCPVLT
eukprot:3818327-Rhodomonas_salina.6